MAVLTLQQPAMAIGDRQPNGAGSCVCVSYTLAYRVSCVTTGSERRVVAYESTLALATHWQRWRSIDAALRPGAASCGPVRGIACGET